MSSSLDRTPSLRARNQLWQGPPPPVRTGPPQVIAAASGGSNRVAIDKPLRSTMKIVLAEKVSPATLAVFQTEAGWQIVTHDQIKNGLAAELADADALVVRSAVQVDEGLLEAAPKLR